MSKSEQSASAEAWLLLQLAVTYGVAADLKESRVVGYLAAVSRKQQMVDMCRAMGLEGKMKGVLRCE